MAHVSVMCDCAVGEQQGGEERRRKAEKEGRGGVLPTGRGVLLRSVQVVPSPERPSRHHKTMMKDPLCYYWEAGRCAHCRKK